MKEAFAGAEPLPHDATTTLAAFSAVDLGEGARRAGRLFAEALLFTLVGVALTQALDVDQPGVLSLFLAAGALGSRAKQILKWAEDNDPLPAARDLFALFAGMMFAYAMVALWLGESGVAHDFAFALEAAQTGSDDLLNRQFPRLLPLLGHNLSVLVAIVILSFVYRTYGALLALAWNASVWGMVVTALAVRAVSGSGDHWAVVVAGFALLPHLVLEAFAYSLGSLAGAGLGRRLTMQSDFQIGSRTFLAAAAVVVLAAMVESLLPGAVHAGLDLAGARV